MRRVLLLAFVAVALAGCEDKKPTPPPAGGGEVKPAGGDTKAAPGATDAKPGETAAAQPAATGDVLIGEVGSLTGNEATFGTSTHNGIELAIKEANEQGGVKGRKLALKVLDDQGKPEEAATAATRLITQDGAVLLLGEVASTRSIAMASVAENNKVPMVSPSSTNPKVTVEPGPPPKTRDYVFRVCFIDPFQGYVMAKFARENMKITKAAILKDVRNDYSMGLAEVFATKFKELGGEIVKEESYSAGDKDFKAQLAAIKGSNPQAILVPGYYTDVALIARQSKRLGIDAPLLGGDGWDSPKLFEIAGDSIDGGFFSNHYSTQDPSPKIQKFVKDYKAAYGDVPDGLAAMGYDAARVSIDAMRRAKSLSGPDLKDALAATKNFDGVTGNISINDKHDAVKPAVVIKVEGGKLVYQTTIAP